MTHRIGTCLALAFMALAWPGAVAAEIASAWKEQPNVRVRLVAGREDKASASRWFTVEMALASGWKTYWRVPGDAGIPPSFDWKGSDNATVSEVYYPAPILMVEKDGTSIGYKNAVSFPVRVKAADLSQPSRIKLALAFGVCKNICIPAEVDLALDLAAGYQGGAGVVDAAMKAVPLPPSQAAATAPKLVRVDVRANAAAPTLRFSTERAEQLYVEAPDSLFVPLANVIGPGLFEIDLSKTPDAKDLKGKPLRVTIVGPGGGIDTTWTLPN